MTSALITPSNVAGVWIYTVRINDPNNPGTGLSQPMAYDQWANFYGRCFCYGSRISVIFQMTGTDEGEAVLYPSTTLQGASTLNVARQQPYAKFSTYSNLNTQNTKDSRIYNRITMRKIVGRPLQGVNFEANVNSSPSRLAYWNLLGVCFDGTVDDILFRVNVTYWCRFYQRNTLGSS